MLPSLARLLVKASNRWPDLPDEILDAIDRIVGGDDPCRELRKLCEVRKDLCSEDIYRAACSHFRYNTVEIRDAFLATRPARIREAAAANRWRVCFRQLCARSKLDDFVLNDAIDYACENNMTHPTYGHISYWDVSEVTDMRGAFLDKHEFNANITLWDVSNVTKMSYMFNDAHDFNQPLEWDVSRVENMTSMFDGAHAFNWPLRWNVSNVTKMQSMFNDAYAFNQPLDWNVSSVKDMCFMFDKARAFNQPLDWDVSQVSDMGWMFARATDFNQPIDLLFIKGPPNPATDTRNMFHNSGQTDMPAWYAGPL